MDIKLWVYFQELANNIFYLLNVVNIYSIRWKATYLYPEVTRGERDFFKFLYII